VTLMFSKAARGQRVGLSRRSAALSALALTIGLGGVVKSYAQQPAVSPDQQAPLLQTQAPSSPPAPSDQPASSNPKGSLPQIVVRAAKKKTNTKPVAETARPAAPPVDAATAAWTALDNKMHSFDQQRANLSPTIGASTYTITRQTIEDLPQGDNTPIDKVILQMPGVSYDSAVSNPNYHVRSEYANVQIRINGVVVPEGVSALGPFLDTNFIGRMSLLTGALPAEYGLRTAGVLDITSRSFATPGGEVSVYGGSRETFTPSFDYGGSVGNNSEYFVSARGNWNNLGLENPTAGINANHDYTDQGKFFGYASTLIDNSTRLSVISAASYSKFQIPNNPAQTTLGDFGPMTLSSTALNENEDDSYYLTMASLQKHGTDGDAQLSVFARYAEVHFVPDIFNDLAFNDVASDVIRQSTLTGTQFDSSYILNDRHTLRGGFAVTGEQTNVTNVSQVLPVDPITMTVPAGSAPFGITDQTSLLGWNIGTYVQDEWKITNQLTVNVGLRFDQLYQFVDANQLSPRFGLVYKPWAGTTFHAGYSRYFTPPYQAQATQSNIALFANTTNQPDIAVADPVKPERSNYFDAGIDQTILPGLDMGIDMYYKEARDMLDDGQFGQAVVLTQFNWARGYSEGGEFKLKYYNGNLNAYANFAYNISRAIGAVSNQYLFDADEFAYLQNHYHYTDDMQRMTGSAGVSYRYHDTLVTADMIYGSGLRAGELDDGVVPNSLHTTAYAVINTGIAQDFHWSPDVKPLTVRFDVVNLFDQIYELRDGSGIGVFAPQFGARRGFYMGLSQKL
jgi:outer membrane receptor protein involved in Fe transport